MAVQVQTMQHRKQFVISAAYFAVIFGILFLVVKYLLPFLWPFLFGFAIAFLFYPLGAWVSNRTGLNQKSCSLLVILIAYALLATGLWLVGVQVVQVLRNILSNLSGVYEQSIQPLVDWLERRLSDLPEAGTVLGGLLSSVQVKVGELSADLLMRLARLGTGVPGFLVSFCLTVMASVFIILDYRGLTRFLHRQLSPGSSRMLLEIKGNAVKTAWGYLRSTWMLMLITFAELSVGFWVIRLDNPIGMAAVISLCDALPILGTGGIVIPWIILELLQGHYDLTISLTVLYLIVTVVRSIIEPKILGKQLGLNPLLTLFAVYIGYHAMGFLGMILFPMAIRVVMNLQQQGCIRFWKD